MRTSSFEAQQVVLETQWVIMKEILGLNACAGKGWMPCVQAGYRDTASVSGAGVIKCTF